MASEKFTLSEKDQETHKDIEILHVFPNDQDADLPLLVIAEDNKKVIIPTFKKKMQIYAPDFFKIFDKKKPKFNLFKESKHEDGSIYETVIPGLVDPDSVGSYIRFLRNYDDLYGRYGTYDNSIFVDEHEKRAFVMHELNFRIGFCMDYFCISKYWQNKLVIECIIDFVKYKVTPTIVPTSSNYYSSWYNQLLFVGITNCYTNEHGILDYGSLFELLGKIVYQYNFEDFDDIIDYFMAHQVILKPYLSVEMAG